VRQPLVSDSIKTIPLRQLVREPLKVKRWTRAGQTVRVTDNGRPLWVVQADPADQLDKAHQEGLESDLTELLQQPKSALSLSEIIKDSRR
jgi:hypothetical protein